MVALDEQFHHDDTMAQSGPRACGQFAQKPVNRGTAAILPARRRHGTPYFLIPVHCYLSGVPMSAATG